MAQITNEHTLLDLPYITREALRFGVQSPRYTNLTQRDVQTPYNGVASVTFVESVTERAPTPIEDLVLRW